MTTVSLTPSQEIIDAANRVVKITDSLGRMIGIRKMTASIKRRVFLAISGENQGKPLYLGQVMIAAAVVEIDGVPVPLPQNDIQFGALIDRLGDEGADAIGAGYVENFGTKEDATAKAGE